jgi:hypothetical protein
MSSQGNTPSTLSDVLRYIEAIYALIPDETTVFFDGEEHLESEGAPGRIIFVQTEDGGELGPPLAIGANQAASITETVVCYVWGSETVADADRCDDAKARSMRLLAAFKAAAPGRLAMRRLSRMKGTNIVTFGEEWRMTIAYTWAVPQDRAVTKAAKTLGGPSPLPPDPDRPDGNTGMTFTFAPTLLNTRP